MNLIHFVIRHNGKPVDFDGVYGAECVDLFREYCAELGFNRTESVAGASELFTKYHLMPNLILQFDRITRSKDVVPQAGDVIIWDKNPKYGHVAICITADESSLLVVEQHGYEKDDKIKKISEREKYLSPSELKLNSVHVWMYNYENILGWLRPKNKVIVA